MATGTPRIKLGGLADRLVRDQLLTEEQALQAIEDAAKKKVLLVQHLIAESLVEPVRIAYAAAQEFGVPLLDLASFDIEICPISLVEEKLIRQHNALPLYKRGKRLFVAVSDPTNLRALDEIKFHTGITTEPVLVEEDKLAAAIDTALTKKDQVMMSDLLDEDLENISISFGEEENVGVDVDTSDVDDAPVVRFVNKVLLDAINKGASDIHFEPYERYYRIRLRQDGVLREVASPPIALSTRFAARLKVMSRMDIAERRVPQDGKIKMNLTKTRYIDFRVSSCPTVWGEKIVLRLLDASATKMGIETLGFEPEQLEHFLKALKAPYGMILVTGPTGSGKTVTLYTGLNILNEPGTNISTVEDPVEMNIPGINQVHANFKAGLDFGRALRAFLRQDPDVIMVGEVRDLDTAEIAVKASLTGHLVLSTLHTNDAPQTLTRLLNMGVPRYNIASSVSLIIAQRLVRKLCNNCKKLKDVPRQVLLQEGFREDEVDGLQVFGPVGCEHCYEGYKGRVGIYQVMPVTEEIGRIIMEGGSAIQITDQAELEGVSDLRKSGLRKVKAGITSLEELNRVTKD